jgi:ATP-dependent exoDNAse (exonuclease V) beta subunit
MQYVQTETCFQQFLRDFNIDINRKKLAALPLFTLIHEIFGIYSFSTRNPFLMRLLDESENFITKNNSAISLFLEWWEEKGNVIALSTPSGVDAVTISTIHKSKGLEYPVVIFPFRRLDTSLTKPNILLQDSEHITGLEYDWVTFTDAGTPKRFRNQYDEELRKTHIDRLNRLYVAHTRAGKELHIITEKESKGNYSKFLKEWCETNAVLPSSPPLTLSSFPPLVSSSPNPFIPSSSHPFILSSPNSPQAAYGLFIHNFLSSLTIFPQNEEEIKEVVQSVEDPYKEHLTAIFNKILNDPSLALYFTSKVKVLNETSILFPDGNLLRPDKVIFIEDKVVVIDYKTGVPDLSHEKQIAQYCDAIRDMGYKKVEGKILYI